MISILKNLIKTKTGELIIYNGYGTTKNKNIYYNDRITIGKSKKNTICIPDHNLSDNQLTIDAEKECIYVSNNSGKSIIVDGIPVNHDHKIPVYNCADVKMNLSSFYIHVGKSSHFQKKSNKKIKKIMMMMIVGFSIMLLEWFLIFNKNNIFNEQTDSSKLKIAQTDNDQNQYTEFVVPSPKIEGMPLQPIIDSALSIFNLAEQMYNERYARIEASYMCIEKFKEGITLLAMYSNRSPVEKHLDQAVQSITIALAYLDNEFNRYQSEIELLLKKEDYEEAQMRADEIIKLIPDIKDLRHVWAKEKLEQIKTNKK